MISPSNQQYPKSVHKVIDILDVHNCNYEVRVFEQPAHHAKQAADLLACPLGAIIKSLVFVTEDKEFFLVLVSGKNRVDTNKLRRLIGRKVSTASPQAVKDFTGYPVGAVPPFGIIGDFDVIIDEDLLSYGALWASAGSENILIRFRACVLQELTEGRICQIKRD